ncbi:MAG: ABC transporter substrate-binding protein [Bryobacteraceae bacterium]
MKCLTGVRCATALLSCAFFACPQDSPPKPYRDARGAPRSYNGPGRDIPEPDNLKDVAIAYFGPPEADHPDGGQMWQGLNLAFEEANRQGGYHGHPFRVVPAWTGNPWAGGAASLIRTLYSENPWAIIGGIDGATTHLAEQVIAKVLVTLINPAATDRSIHSANVPWIFSCAPGDQMQAPLISHELQERGEPFILVSATDHDSRAFVSELRLAFTHDRLSPALHVEFEASKPKETAGRLEGTAAKAVVVIAGAADSTEVIEDLRSSGYTGRILASASIARAGTRPALVGVEYPVIGNISAAFRTRFAARYGADPDYTAAYAYDAATIAITSIRRAGLNRARIRDAVQGLSPFSGVTGTIEWDPLGQNGRPVKLRTIQMANRNQWGN